MQEQPSSKIDNMLEELLERQRLSRFDNVMLLMYPTIISGSAILAYGLLNISALRDIMILYVPLSYILFDFAIFYLLGLCGTFVIFIWAYIQDKIKLRVNATNLFLHIVTISIALIVSMYLIAPVVFVASKYAIVGRYTSTVFIIAVANLAYGTADWLQMRILSWLFVVAKRRFQREQIDFDKLYLARKYFYKRFFGIGQFFLLASCSTYVWVLSRIFRFGGGLTPEFFSYLVGFVAMVLATAVIFKRESIVKRIKGHVSL
jgi:hypothetical protein